MKLNVFGKNAFIYSLGSVALRASGFLLIPLYTHYLSLNDFGILSILLLTMQILITLIDFGIINSLMRFLPEYEALGILYKLLGTSLLLNLLSGSFFGMLAYVVLVQISDTIIKTESAQLYIILTILASIAQSLCVNMMSYYRAKNLGFKYTVISIVITLILISTSSYFLIYLNLGITGVLISQIIAYGLIWAYITYVVFLREKFGFSISVFKKLAGYGYPLIFARSGDLMMLTLSTYFLGYFSSTADVGIYSLAYKIASIEGILLILPFQLAFEPYIFANIKTEEIKKTIASLTTYLLLTMAFTSFIIVFAFRDFISIIAPQEYSSAYLVTFLILPGLSLSGIHTIAQTLLHINNKTKVTGIVVGSISLVSMILSYFLIPQLNISGIIISFNFFQSSVALLLMYLGNKSFPIKFEYRRIIISLIVYATWMIGVYTLKDANSIFFYSVSFAVILVTAYILLKIDFLSIDEKEKLNFYLILIQNKFSSKN
jgi:O-antigen/teichoic acid export membrane protein